MKIIAAAWCPHCGWKMESITGGWYCNHCGRFTTVSYSYDYPYEYGLGEEDYGEVHELEKKTEEFKQEGCTLSQ